MVFVNYSVAEFSIGLRLRPRTLLDRYPIMGRQKIILLDYYYCCTAQARRQYCGRPGLNYVVYRSSSYVCSSQQQS